MDLYPGLACTHGRRPVRTAELAKDGSTLGVDRQVDECMAELIQPRGWTLRHTFVDNNLSATTGVSPSGLRGSAGGVARVPIVVWHTDRLVRVNRDLERVIAWTWMSTP
jgi:site-specific DNA recombinase